MPQIIIPVYLEQNWNYPNSNNDIVIWTPDQVLSGFDTITLLYAFLEPQPFGGTLPTGIIIKLQYSDDGLTWTDATSLNTLNQINGPIIYHSTHNYYRFEVDSIVGSTSFSIQIYYQYLKTGV